jgi:hypothetical protein
VVGVVTTEPIERGRWYPEMPPALLDETDAQYTDRLTGADLTARRPYDHQRFRSCSIGYHGECSQRDSENPECECPCHTDPLERWDDARRFKLVRHEDITGISGTGVVADGVVWPDGTVSIRWQGDRPSVVFWESIEDAYAVHGHGGATTFEWLDR